MKKVTLVCMIGILLLLTACTTTDVQYKDNFLGLATTGEATIILSRAVPQLTLLVDDKILIDARWMGTRRVNISNLPLGTHTIQMFANSWQLEENFSYTGTITVKRANTPIMLEVPQYSPMYWIYTISMVILSALPSVAVSY